MKAYRLNIPTKIYFGRNILEEALKEQQEFVRGTVLIVTSGRSLIRLGYLNGIQSILQGMMHVKKVVVFSEVSANPRLSEVKIGINIGKKAHADIIIGLGGGSALDAAKAIAAGIGHDENIEDFFYGHKEATEKTLPIVAIPTTAGTGSELSKAAILTDDKRKVKGGIRGAALYPAIAIVDSAFTETVPKKITMETGFDVLAHAVESYISKASTPYTEMQSEYVIHTVGTYLPRLVLNLGDIEAREKMSFASMIMGINLGNASTCLPHRLQYPIGAHTDTSHGLGLAALFSTWMTYEYKYSRDKLNKVIKLLKNVDCRGYVEAMELMSEFIRSLGLPVSLREIGVTESLIDRIVNEVTGNIQNDPAAQEKDIIDKIYRTAF